MLPCPHPQCTPPAAAPTGAFARVQGLWLLLLVLVWLPVVGFGYVWDDDALIVANLGLDGWDGVVSAFSGSLWDHTPSAAESPHFYRPVMRLSLVLDRWMGWGAAGAHAHSLLWHLVSVAGVVALARHLGVSAPVAVWAGALAGLHPVQVEAVAWISARNDLLALAGMVWTLVWVRSGRGPLWVALGVAWSAASKESAYLLPLLVMVAAYGLPRPWRAAGGAWLGLGLVVVGRVLAGVGWPQGADGAHLWASAAPAAMWWVDALGLPQVRVPGQHLAWPSPVPWLGLALGGGCGLVVLGGVGWRGIVILGLGALASLPAWPAIAHVGLLGDRYAAAGVVAVAVVGGLGLEVALAREWRRVGWGIAAAAVLACAVQTTRSLPAWQSDRDLWEAAVQVHPNGYTWGALAKVAELSGDDRRAAVAYHAATQGPIPFAAACWNIARFHLQAGRADVAAAEGRRALAAGCAVSAELVCPTALSLLVGGDFAGGRALAADIQPDPTGQCVLVRLVGAAQDGLWTELNAATGTDGARRGALAAQLQRVLEAGGDGATAEAVDRWAQTPTDAGHGPQAPPR